MARRRVALNNAALAVLAEAVRVKLRKAGVRGAWLEDLAQSVLLTWIQKGPRGRVSHVLPWLLDVARKKAANWRRRFFNVREVTSLEELPEPADETIDIERQSMVREALPTLTPRERAVVEAFSEGLSMREMAGRFGVGKSGVHRWAVDIRGRAAWPELHAARARPRKRERKKP